MKKTQISICILNSKKMKNIEERILENAIKIFSNERKTMVLKIENSNSIDGYFVDYFDLFYQIKKLKNDINNFELVIAIENINVENTNIQFAYINSILLSINPEIIICFLDKNEEDFFYLDQVYRNSRIIFVYSDDDCINIIKSISNIKLEVIN